MTRGNTGIVYHDTEREQQECDWLTRESGSRDYREKKTRHVSGPTVSDAVCFYGTPPLSEGTRSLR